MGTGTVIAFLFALAKAALPLITKWIADAQRAGIVSEAEKNLLGQQALGLAQELGAWNEITTRTSDMSDSDLRDLVTGVRKEGTASKPKP